MRGRAPVTIFWYIFQCISVIYEGMENLNLPLLEIKKKKEDGTWRDAAAAALQAHNDKQKEKKSVKVLVRDQEIINYKS